jgi:hypothetical protein
MNDVIEHDAWYVIRILVSDYHQSLTNLAEHNTTHLVQVLKHVGRGEKETAELNQPSKTTHIN